jgi:hypothetical protein
MKFTSKFSPILSRRSIFHVSVIQKYTLLWSILHHDRTHYSIIVTENKWLMEMITAAHRWQIINKFPRMNHTAPNVIGHQAYWFIGRICMCLAAGSASVTMKHRAVNQSTNLRTSLYNKLVLKKVINTRWRWLVSTIEVCFAYVRPTSITDLLTYRRLPSCSIFFAVN